MRDDHPAYAAPCPLCPVQLGSGAPVQYLAVGPPPFDGTWADDVHDQRWSAAAVLVHEPCLAALDEAGMQQLLCVLVVGPESLGVPLDAELVDDCPGAELVAIR